MDIFPDGCAHQAFVSVCEEGREESCRIAALLFLLEIVGQVLFLAFLTSQQATLWLSHHFSEVLFTGLLPLHTNSCALPLV